MLTNSESSFSRGPYIIFINKFPPGFKHWLQNYNIYLFKAVDLTWSTNLSPIKSGTASEHIISALIYSKNSYIFSYTFLSEIFPYINFTPGIGIIYNKSTAIMVSLS
jgi:hypothetical protein